MGEAFAEEELLLWQVFRQEVPLHVTCSSPDPRTPALNKLDFFTNAALVLTCSMRHGRTLTHHLPGALDAPC